LGITTTSMPIQGPAGSRGATGSAGASGADGVAGATGATGPPGQAGAGATITFTFTQAAPLNPWTIIHNLGRFPSVTVVDSSGHWVVAEVQYLSSNSLVVSFNAPYAGTAYLN
jgi:hypothetical protein